MWVCARAAPRRAMGERKDPGRGAVCGRFVASARLLPGHPGQREVVAVIFAVLVGGSTLGFLAGLFSFKVKSRWCRVHGVVKRCPLCAGQANRTVRA
jgi:hypothetical protein